MPHCDSVLRDGPECECAVPIELRGRCGVGGDRRADAVRRGQIFLTGATNVAITTIGRDLGFKQSDLQWPLNVYSCVLVYRGLMAPISRAMRFQPVLRLSALAVRPAGGYHW